MHMLFLSLSLLIPSFIFTSESKRPNTPVVNRLKEDSKKNPAAIDYPVLKKSNERNQHKGRSQSNPVISKPKKSEAPKAS